jgi:hypothetical protein
MTAAHVVKTATAKVIASHVGKLAAAKVATTKMATTATTCECISSHRYISERERGGKNDGLG